MDIQQIHERFDNWNFEEETNQIVLEDANQFELERIDVTYLLDLWFNKQDE